MADGNKKAEEAAKEIAEKEAQQRENRKQLEEGMKKPKK